MSLHTNDENADDRTIDAQQREGGESPTEPAGWDGDPADLPDGTAPSPTGFWITRGDGGRSRRLHDDPECTRLTQSGHNETTARPASEYEVKEMERGERDRCSVCDGNDGRGSGAADTFDAYDVRRLAKEGRLDELGDLVRGESDG